MAIFYILFLPRCSLENYRLETKYENHLIGKVALVCIYSFRTTLFLVKIFELQHFALNRKII